MAAPGPADTSRAPGRALRIAIATSGRFHVLDLARELARLGHDVRLYSMLPDARAEKFGLERRYHRSLLAFVAPLVAWQRYAPRIVPKLQNRLLSRALDRIVTAVLEPCNVLICMSGIFVCAIEAAKSRYGARVWLERGSRHILSQAEILAATAGARPGPDVIARELAGYRLADRIVVPSLHVAESFERDPGAHTKLFVNPYGTKLDMFPYRERGDGAGEPLRLLYAGNWSLQKGCDLLVEVVRATPGVNLTHVGALIDADFPVDRSRFVHHDAVQQTELARFYAEAHGFVLASRQDGFGLVLAQALASGLPVICTDRTGGEDLAHTPALRERIIVVPNSNGMALREAIERLRERLRNGPRFSPLTSVDLETLSWSAYGKRYEAELSRC
jgi:glycosyltransferase involved in cell wall biosynthesis